MSTLRLAALVSHPIQYEVPFYRQLADHREVEFTVFYCSTKGLDVWDVPLLQGYDFEFLTSGPTVTDVRMPVRHVNPKIVGRLSEGNYDALLVNGWMSVTNWLAFAVASQIGLPVILRGDSNLRGTASDSWLTDRFTSAVLSRFFAHVDVFATIGTENERFYEQHGVPQRKFVPAPLVVDNDWFRAQASKLPGPAELRRKRDVPTGRPVVLFLGRLVDRKRPGLLLEAFVEATQPGEATLAFVGKGPERDRLERTAARQGRRDDVVFAGFVEQSELPAYYKLADLFVIPSAEEPWGLVVNEAMNVSLPIIATDVVGAAVDLVDEENGVVVPTDDQSALAAALSRLLGDQQLRQQMGAVSRERIENWSPERAAEQLVKAARLARSKQSSSRGE